MTDEEFIELLCRIDENYRPHIDRLTIMHIPNKAGGEDVVVIFLYETIEGAQKTQGVNIGVC